jgi:predicted small lipoprotein YifL
MIRILIVLSFVIAGLTACGSKKPQEKVDHEKVDKAYNDFNKNNN